MVLLFVWWSNHVNAQYFLVDTLALNRAYDRVVAAPGDTSAQKAFFEAFPASWPEFASTYGYVDASDYDLAMYNRYAPHCAAFANLLPAIPDSVYCQKAVEAAVGARIGADAPAALRLILHGAMKSRRRAMLGAITSMLRADRVLYWQFYWSSVLDDDSQKQEFIELRDYMKQNGYADDVAMMERAFNDFHGKSSFIDSRHVGQRRYVGKDF